MDIAPPPGYLVTGLLAGKCADCGSPVNQHTSRYWHSDRDGLSLLCYPCFEERCQALANLPPERDVYMREILARESSAGDSAERGANWVGVADDSESAAPDEEIEPDPSPCPECGGPRIVANVRGDVRLAYRDSLFGLGILSNTRMYALVCRACGLTALYAYDPKTVFPPGSYAWALCCRHLLRERVWQLLAHGIAHGEFLYLAGDGHGKAVHEDDVARYLEAGDLAATMFAYLFLGGRRALGQLDPGANLLAILGVGHANDLHVGDLGVRV